MGEVAAQVGEYVTAYSGDLKDESLDGQRIVVGGIVVGSRTVVTRTRSTMAIVTLEDLQGSLEVVVFPRLFEQTGPTWQEGAILLVSGRVDHRGEDVSLLADLVFTWEDAVARGPESLAREVANGDRGPRRRSAPVPNDGGRNGASVCAGAAEGRAPPPPWYPSKASRTARETNPRTARSSRNFTSRLAGWMFTSTAAGSISRNRQQTG